jgi:hypothetical protein
MRNLRLTVFFVVAACGSDGTGGADGADADLLPTADAAIDPPKVAAEITGFDIAATKLFRFNWQPVDDATFYQLEVDPDGASGFSQEGADIAGDTADIEIVVPLYARIGAQYRLKSCNAGGCVDSAPITVDPPALKAAIGYFKASNAEARDNFGAALDLSDDGTVLAVSAIFEDSGSAGVDGDQSDNSLTDSGAVYVFRRIDNAWAQEAYLKASNPDEDEPFGMALSLSGDGNTLAVSSWYESSNATGINGDQADNSEPTSGAVYVFRRANDLWSQEAYIKSSTSDKHDFFGRSVGLSDDGSVLAVGAPGDEITPDLDRGAAFVFTRTGTTWSEEARLVPTHVEDAFFYGQQIALSGDGTTLAVGDPAEGYEPGGQPFRSGAVYVYRKTGGDWQEQAYLKNSVKGESDQFGDAISLDQDGDTLAVGAPYEDGGSISDETDDSKTYSGAAYIFSRTGSDWNQEAYIKASNADEWDLFGYSVDLSDDGNTLAVVASDEQSSATGLGGDQTDNSLDYASAIYVLNRTGIIWTHKAYVKSPLEESDDGLRGVALSGDGQTLAAKCSWEDGTSQGINGTPDKGASQSGAVFLY